MNATAMWTVGGLGALLVTVVLLTRGSGTPHVAPPMPGGLVLLAQGDSTLTVGWHAVPGSVTYTVSLGGGTVLTGITGNQVTLTGLTPGTAYTVGVAACNAAGCSAAASLQATTTAPPPAPGAPTGLAAGNITGSSFDLTWDPVPTATSYIPYLDGVAYAAVTVPQMHFSGLNLDTTYHASVAAVAPGGTSAPSAPLAVTTALL